MPKTCRRNWSVPVDLYTYALETDSVFRHSDELDSFLLQQLPHFNRAHECSPLRLAKRCLIAVLLLRVG